MIDWLITEIPILRYEYIGLYILSFLFGLLGSIAWVTLALEIRPDTLKSYMSKLFISSLKHWLNKEVVENNPISNQEKKSKESEDTACLS